MTHKLSLEKLSYRREGRWLFENINLTFKPGTHVITGLSGSGKSTLANLIAGYLTPTSGTIVLNDREVDESFLGQHIGFMFQNPSLQFCMHTVEQELVFVMENLCFKPNTMNRNIREALNFVDMVGYEKRVLMNLSGGEKQRISLACLYLMDPEVVILDEPFASLDMLSRDHLLANILKWCDQKIVLLIDHEINYYIEQGYPIYQLHNRNMTLRNDNDTPKSNVRKNDPGQTCASFQDYTVAYADPLFLPVTFDCSYHELIHISGPSGIGKTSFFYGVLGLMKHTGFFSINGRPYKAKDLNIGYVFQNPQDQFLTTRVLSEIMIGSDDRQAAESWLREFKLWEAREQSPYTLSQGEQRRLALACVFMHNFDVIFVDEPTYGQDATIAWTIMEIIQSYALKHHVVILFTSHDDCLSNQFRNKQVRLEHV